MFLKKGKEKIPVTEHAILEALGAVMDPDLGRDIVSLGFIKNLTIKGSKVAFDVELTTPACPVKDLLKAQCEQVVGQLEGVHKVAVNMTARVRSGRPGKRQVPGVRNILAVASGKGGVGKSTVSFHLALALASKGARVGLMDCDIYGPSHDLLFGCYEQPNVLGDQRLVPHSIHGLQVMSMGFLAKPGQAIVWRGPMLHKMVQQFLFHVAWGDLDYLVLDLPPGTGDVQLSLTQATPLTAGLVVTTPQEAALRDARKALEMFKTVDVPVIGFVENMSAYTCRKCGKRHDLFQSGGGQKLAADYNLPLLGQLPLAPQLADMEANGGVPAIVCKPKSEEAGWFFDLAGKVAAQISKTQLSQTPAAPKTWAMPGPNAIEV